jgi:hypothetical protein
MRVALIGADSDTYGAIAGALLGAYHPEIPGCFTKDLEAYEEIWSIVGRVIYIGMNLPQRPIVVFPDLHGHLDLFEWALEAAARITGRDDFILVTLGDYMDNGPQIPALVERLARLQANPGRLDYQPIAGNHDVACMLAYEPRSFNAPINPRSWYTQWSTNYWNYDGRTPFQYGAKDKASFRALFPPRHNAFLHSLPWYRRIGNYLFIHSGLYAKQRPEDQLAEMAARDLSSLRPGQLLPQLRDKSLACTHDPENWDAVVISGHTKFRDGLSFVQKKRITFHSGACQEDPLNCAILDPEGRGDNDLDPPIFFSVDQKGVYSVWPHGTPLSKPSTQFPRQTG